MTQNPKDILKRYWGFDDFRGIQEQVIREVLAGRDTLALMPTGGGKSLCFQIPSLSVEGLCVVISPLIALMNDQVERLNSMEIRAYALTSEMHRKEIELILNNCIHDKRVKFLYVSPERLKTDAFIFAFKQMNVNLIAVDEAHCISQWGYDFRPPYLEIAEIRKYRPGVPVLALTATATEGVAKDICHKLRFAEENIVKMSFARKNLAYVVMQSESKLKSMTELLSKISGSAIVYAGTRRRVKELSDALNKHNMSASFYHAGLTPDEKKASESDWKSNKRRIMVATNAFGMGIDKADVRLVIHADVPADPEAYFQEAGRAGRDGQKAYAVLLWENKDLEEIRQRIEQKYPSLELIKSVYTGLCLQSQISFNDGAGSSFPLRLNDLCEKLNRPMHDVFAALKLLETGGYILINDQGRSTSKLRLVCDQRQLYDFRLRHPEYDGLIQHLLRSHEGLFELYVKPNENLISRQLKITKDRLAEMFRFMVSARIADYVPATSEALVTFIQNRPQNDTILLHPSIYRDRKKADLLRSEVMVAYLRKSNCRSVELLSYFGETNTKACGICDICRAKSRQALTSEMMEKLSAELDKKITEHRLDADRLLQGISLKKREDAARIVRWKVDTGAWGTDTSGYLYLREPQ